MLSTASGFQNLLKEGFRHYAGLEEAILRNIEACKEISDKTKTSIGPNGMKKIVVNHIDKLFITSDASTMLREIEVNHPAAKMIVMATKMQEQECGDMTNFIITFVGELLNQAQDLIKLGLHPSDIVLGYEVASKKALETLKSFNHYEISDISNVSQVLPVIETALCPKMPGYYQHFAKIITEACVKILPQEKEGTFNLDHVRIVKIIGGGLADSHLVNGMVIERPPLGTIQSVEGAKIACYNCPFDINNGETKGTVLIKNASDLLNFSKSEETLMERHIKSIADAGVKLVVVGGSVSELAVHYLEKYEIMAIRIMSKFDLMRIVRCLGATAIPNFGAPTQEELGHCKRVYVKEIGSEKVTIFEKDDSNARLMTVVVRGATKAILEDVSRSIGHGLNTFKVTLKNKVFVHGAGATEAHISNLLNEEALKTPGLEQYSIARFAESFQIIGRHLIENAGMKFNTVLPDLVSGNKDKVAIGVDVLNGQLATVEELKVYDNLYSKTWALRLASDVALTILRIDQIIVAKPAGGPKPKSTSGWDNED